MKITVYSHFIKVSEFEPRISGLLLKFCARYIHRGIGPSRDKPGEFKVYATCTAPKSEYRFHIFQFKELLDFFQGMYISAPDQIEIIYKKIYEPNGIFTKMKDHWVLRDDQNQAVDFILTPPSEGQPNSKLIELKPGAGKTLTSMAASTKAATRTAVIVLPEFTDKWIGDIPHITTAGKKEVMFVKGGSRLKGLIQMAKDGDFHSDYTIIALTTLKDFYKLYEEDPFGDEFKSYGILPEELFELLGIGTVIIDEGHKHLHGIFKLIMYMHVPLLTVLTGTFMSDDGFVSKIQHKMFPSELRFADPVIDRYTKVYALSYDVNDDNFKLIKTTQPGSSNYSHTAFEKSIMKNRILLQKYMKMVVEGIHFLYTRELMPGDKIAIYAATIKLCTYMTEYLKDAFPNLDVRRYVEDDPYENIIEPDMRVTTIGSGGTGIDIPGLRAVLMTTSISSSTSNIQVFGRLRKLKDRDVKFGYMYSPRIKKQMFYHRKRKELLRDRAASIKDLNMSLGLW
jgi:hypothetical protein